MKVECKNIEGIEIACSNNEIMQIMVDEKVLQSEYINAFAQKMKLLSNRLNEIPEDDDFRDDLDIAEDYLPAIRQFIVTITGL